MLWIVVLLTVALAAACFQVVRGQRQYDRLLRLHDEVLTVPPALVTPVLASVAQALGDGVLVFQPDRRIIFSNAKLAEILELSSDHVVGNTLITVLRDYHADALIEQAMTTGERQTTTIQPVLSERRLLITCQPLDAPHKGGGVVVVRDLTQLAYLERARRELVANVSHELRTPLASILLLVETLHSEPPPALARRMLGQIEDEAQALTQLVDELRELAQIESGRLVLQVQTLPLVPVLERAVDRLRAQAERRNLALLTNFAPDLPAVLIDPDRISQVFLNLLHNALKFTPDGGTITVQAVAATPPPTPRVAQELHHVEGSDWVLVTVRDTGVGIPARETERVFERFYKVDRARTRNSGGTGLGLAIVKHLVERHGGRVWADSQEGVGSVFSLLLPVA